MGKSGKKKVQPYILFCTEQEQTVKDFQGKTIPQLVELCSGAWSNLDSDTRQRYVDMAKEYSDKGYYAGKPTADLAVENVVNEDLTGKFDCYGRSELAKQEDRRREKFWKDAMKADVDARIERANNHNKIPQMIFHIASVNTWLELGTGEVIPSEIGLVQMSVQGGVLNRYNQMISPGVMPVGYKSEAKDNSEKYHKIWLDNPQLSDNYRAIVSAVAEEVRVPQADTPDHASGVNGRYAGEDTDIERRCQRHNVDMSDSAKAAKQYQLMPIYAMSHEMERVRKAFKWLCDKVNANGEEDEVKIEFTFYDLPYFFWRLVEVAPLEYLKKMTPTIAEAHLSADVFLYVAGVSCEYHDTVESCCCSGGRSTRFAFILCDFCCQLYSQRPLEGRHVPNGIPIIDYATEHSLAPSGGGYGSSYGRSMTSNLELERVPASSTVEDETQDQGDRLTAAHPLSDIMTKSADGVYLIPPRGQPKKGAVLRVVPPSVLEQIGQAKGAYSAEKDPDSIRKLVAAVSLEQRHNVTDDAVSFVSARSRPAK